MGFDPNKIKTGAERESRKIVLYGPPKLGKSTLAASAENALLVPTEDRVSHIGTCAKTEIATSYKDILDIFDYILNEKHTYKRVIIDTLDEFEPLLHAAICQKNNWTSLVEDSNKETNFQKGMMYHAVDGWRKFLNNCDHVRRTANVDIILVAHAQTIKVNPPNHDSYDKWAMKIDKHAIPILEGWADIVGFYDKDMYVKTNEKSPKSTGKVVTTSKRILHLSGESAAMVSCNSYGFTDIEVPEKNCADVMQWLLKGPFEDKKNNTTESK